MPTKRGAAAAAEVDGKIYVIGGLVRGNEPGGSEHHRLDVRARPRGCELLAHRTAARADPEQGRTRRDDEPMHTR